MYVSGKINIVNTLLHHSLQMITLESCDSHMTLTWEVRGVDDVVVESSLYQNSRQVLSLLRWLGRQWTHHLRDYWVVYWHLQGITE